MDYDYLILGAGWGGLTQAVLQIKDGKKVCILEASDVLGGYAQSFTKKGYTFCVGPQYLTGCHKGGKLYEFIRMLGLEKKVKFNFLNSDCYDKVVIPGANFEIPMNVKKFEQKLKKQFPDEKQQITQLFLIMTKIYQRIYQYDDLNFKDFIRGIKTDLFILRYGSWTVQQMFDYLKLSKPLCAILAAQSGNYGMIPEEGLFCALIIIIYSFGESAFHPKKGFKCLINEIVNYIKNNGGKIVCGAKVTKIYTQNKKVTKIKISDGRFFTAKKFISNIDPQLTMKLIKGNDKQYDYPYSTSCLTIFLGLNVPLKKYEFGKWNVWAYANQDINTIWKNIYKTSSYKKPFLFMSTPSNYTSKNLICPKNCCTLQIMTPAKYDYFLKLQKKDIYQKEVKRIIKEILDYVETNFIPNLSNKIVVKEVWTPLDYYQHIQTPKANVYGKRLDPKTIIFNSISNKTDFHNLFLVGATTSSPGLGGVLSGSLKLYELLKKE